MQSMLRIHKSYRDLRFLYKNFDLILKLIVYFCARF